MIIAAQFPRDPRDCITRILEACRDKSLAADSTYSYSKGGTAIDGANIRLAEAIIREWGHVHSGVVELERRPGESVVMAYAYDLQRNVRESKTFTIKHERKAYGKVSHIADDREIYEHVANYAARRKRACMLALIPKEVERLALDRCEETLLAASDETLDVRVAKMLSSFIAFGVNKEQIAARMGKNVEAFDVHDVVALGKIYNSLKDGMSAPDQWFEIPKPEDATPADLQTNKKAKKKAKAKPKAEQEAPAEPEANPLLDTLPPDGPATSDDREKMNQIAMMKLAEAGFKTDAANMAKICHGLMIEQKVNDPAKLRHGVAVEIIQTIAGLSVDDVLVLVEN